MHLLISSKKIKNVKLLHTMKNDTMLILYCNLFTLYIDRNLFFPAAKMKSELHCDLIGVNSFSFFCIPQLNYTGFIPSGCINYTTH